MTAPMANSTPPAGLVLVTNSVPLSPATLGSVTPVCGSCGKPLPPAGKGPAKQFCNPTCRQRAHRGQSAKSVAPDRALTRDETVSRLCYALKSHEGLRDGLDTLCRIVEDERARLQAMPLYVRQQIARRFLAGLGLKLAETEQ